MEKFKLKNLERERGEPRGGKITNITLKLNLLLGKKSTHWMWKKGGKKIQILVNYVWSKVRCIYNAMWLDSITQY